MKNVKTYGTRGNGKNNKYAVKSQYVCSYGRYDIFFQHDHYYVVDVDASIVYFARTLGRCERWIDRSNAMNDLYR